MVQRQSKAAAPPNDDCDFRDMLSRVGDKWSLLVIATLEQRPDRRGRFSELKRSIPGISQRMLTATVRNLERDGLLTRHWYPEIPPRVEYELTKLGKGLMIPSGRSCRGCNRTGRRFVARANASTHAGARSRNRRPQPRSSRASAA